MNRILVPALCAFLFAAPALAKKIENVEVPETETFDGKQLKLNGAGVRSKFWINVYVAALYLETTSKNPNEIVSSDQVKRVQLEMLRDLSKQQVADAVKEGFEKNAKAELPNLQERLNKFMAELKDFKKGEKMVVTYVPGKGTFLSGAGEKFVIEGKDFADALFSVWLGRFPVDDNLKKGLSGA